MLLWFSAASVASDLAAIALSSMHISSYHKFNSASVVGLTSASICVLDASFVVFEPDDECSATCEGCTNRVDDGASLVATFVPVPLPRRALGL